MVVLESGNDFFLRRYLWQALVNPENFSQTSKYEQLLQKYIKSVVEVQHSQEVQFGFYQVSPTKVEAREYFLLTKSFCNEKTEHLVDFCCCTLFFYHFASMLYAMTNCCSMRLKGIFQFDLKNMILCLNIWFSLKLCVCVSVCVCVCVCVLFTIQRKSALSLSELWMNKTSFLRIINHLLQNLGCIYLCITKVPKY